MLFNWQTQVATSLLENKSILENRIKPETGWERGNPMFTIQMLLFFGGIATVALLAVVTCPVRREDPFGC